MNEIMDRISKMKGYVLDLQKKMTSYPAISPALGGKGEFQKAQYIEGELKKLNFDEIFHVDAPDEKAEGGIHPNIIAKYYGKDRSKTLWLMAHMDVVPEGDLSLWKTKPFELFVDKDEDTIYGRGVEDNQQAIIAAIITAKAIMESGKRPPINLGIMFLSDEEVGNQYGLIYLTKQKPDIFGKQDSFIVQDSGDEKGAEVEIAEKNVFWIKFTTIGKQCHASIPQNGANAFEAGANLAVRLMNGLRAKFDKEDTLFAPSKSTFEATKKEANVPNINTIPGTDVFYIDCRFLPFYKPEEVIAEIDKIIAGVEKDFGVKIKYEFLEKVVSVATPKDCELVQLYAKAVKEINKVEPKIIGVGGGTFAADIRNMGLPAVVGSKIYSEPHSPNEKTRLSFALDDAKVLSYVLMHSK